MPEIGPGAHSASRAFPARLCGIPVRHTACPARAATRPPDPVARRATRVPTVFRSLGLGPGRGGICGTGPARILTFRSMPTEQKRAGAAQVTPQNKATSREMSANVHISLRSELQRNCFPKQKPLHHVAAAAFSAHLQCCGTVRQSVRNWLADC